VNNFKIILLWLLIFSPITFLFVNCEQPVEVNIIQESDYSVTSVTTGLDYLETIDLPTSEKNRINTNGTWFYQNRKLATPPILSNNRFDIEPVLELDESFLVTIGCLAEETYYIHFDYDKFLNGTIVPYVSTGDIDLFLTIEGSSTPLLTSTNDEGSDEDIEFYCPQEGNYTIHVLHDSRDSTKTNATGSLKINVDYISNEIQRVYFEGRTIGNIPTSYSNWTSYSTEKILATYIDSPESIDFYQLRWYNDLYDETPAIDDAQTYGIDMGIIDWDGSALTHYVEVEAEWGQGFATIAQTTNNKGIVRLINPQNTFLKYNNLSLTLVVLANKDNTDYYEAEYIYIKNPENKITRYFITNPEDYSIINITYVPCVIGNYEIGTANEDSNNNYHYYPSTSFDVVEDADENKIVEKIGYIGPSDLDCYQIFAKIDCSGNQFEKAIFRYSTNGGTTFNQKDMVWLTEDYVGVWLDSINVETIQWEIIFETNTDFTVYQNDADTGGDAGNTAENATLITLGNYTGECREIDFDNFDFYKFSCEANTEYFMTFESQGNFELEIFDSSSIVADYWYEGGGSGDDDLIILDFYSEEIGYATIKIEWKYFDRKYYFTIAADEPFTSLTDNVTIQLFFLITSFSAISFYFINITKKRKK